jgi:hypothetical protein
MKYTKDQVARIEQVNQAARDFINLLIECPEYLARYLPAQLIVPPMKDTLPTIAADLVSNMLAQHGYIVFYPNHVETKSPAVEYITDVYETEEQMEEHIRKEIDYTSFQ